MKPCAMKGQETWSAGLLVKGESEQQSTYGYPYRLPEQYGQHQS